MLIFRIFEKVNIFCRRSKSFDGKHGKKSLKNQSKTLDFCDIYSSLIKYLKILIDKIEIMW